MGTLTARNASDVVLLVVSLSVGAYLLLVIIEKLRLKLFALVGVDSLLRKVAQERIDVAN